MAKKNKKKRSTKNLKINTSVALASVLAIVIPLVIIATFSTVFVHMSSSYFNFSSVTANTYSTVNQIQWSQTLWSITDELVSDDDKGEKLDKIESFITPLENIGSYVYIECNGDAFYSTATGNQVMEKANSVVKCDKTENINYFGNNGLVIINHTKSTDENYTIVIVNENYTVNDVNQRMSFREFRNLLLSRTGIIVMVIVLLFVIAIAVISSITAKTIVEPVKKIAKGADEIAKGNLDYSIDYESTNELGQTVNSFNDMRLRLKESIEKQTKATQERQVLVAGIAHDLRTPLTSAKGYAEGILDGIADTPEKRDSYIKTVLQSINDTEKILDDLLTVSKLELKGYELNRVDVNAKEFFDDGAQDIEKSLKSHNFDFKYQCTCDENSVISIDPDRFERVISNIISNSIKYAKDGVKGCVAFSVNDYERSVIIEISDNGIGVDKESLPKIFDTMYRADPARTRVSKGSGLGLSICKQIVELHGGSIWAGSKMNEGLSIFISMPKKEVDEYGQNIDN